MNEESHNPLIEPELEARIIAMVLGEASDFEREELNRLIEERPELADFLRQMQRVHGLLQEVGEGEAVKPANHWQLPTEKRNAVLAVIRGDATVQQASTNSSTSAPVRAPGRRRFLRSLVGGAVVLSSLGIGSLALFSFSASEKAESITLAGMRRDDARYQQEPLVGGATLAFELENESAEAIDSTRQSGSVRYSTLQHNTEQRKSLIQTDPDGKNSQQALSAIKDTLGTIAAAPSDHYLGDDLVFLDVDGVRFEEPLETISETETGDREVLRRLSSAIESPAASQPQGVVSPEFMAKSGNAWMYWESKDEAKSSIAQPDPQPNIAAFSLPTVNTPDTYFDDMMLGLIDPESSSSAFGSAFEEPRDEFSRAAIEQQSPDAVMLGESPGIIMGKEEQALGRNLVAQDAKQQTWDFNDAIQPEKASGQINGGATQDFGTQLTSPELKQNQAWGRAYAGAQIAGNSMASSDDESLANREEFRFGLQPKGFDNKAKTPAVPADGVIVDFLEQEGLTTDGEVASGGFAVAGGGLGGRRFDRDQRNDKLQIESPDAQIFFGEEMGDDSGVIVSNETPESEQAAISEKNVLRRQIRLNEDSPAQPAEGFGVEDTRLSAAADYLNFPLAMPTTETATPSLINDHQDDGIFLDLRGPVDVQTMTNAGVLVLSGNNVDVRKAEDAIKALEDQPIVSYSVEQPVQKGRRLQELSIAGQVPVGSGPDNSVERNTVQKFKKASPSKPANKPDELLTDFDGLGVSNEQRGLRYRYVAPSLDVNDQLMKHRELKRTAPDASLAEKSAAEEAFSTFSLHVSDVSFKLAMAALGKGEWPDASKIRIEEFVNAFDYGDALPGQNQKMACAIEQSIHPFLQQRNLMRVSMRTAAAGRASTTPLRLTFLLDNSGSMERYDRQQTVRQAFAMLAQQLTANDQVTLISFARQPRLLADQVSGSEAEKLVRLIEELPSEGGTNIEAALQLAFEKAREQQTPDAQNRIILLTDGAVNLGNANPELLSRMVTTIRSTGIAFDAAGISAEGLNDEVLEALTRKGDGRYYLLDSVEAADDDFAQQIAGALRPSAKNVKVQVEFNPKRVGRYKLLGFEKHVLKKEDFRNDKVDAAEMAAAEAGVAMYQFEALPDGEGDVGSVSVRFLDLSTGQMVENRWPIPYVADAPRPAQAAPSLRIASSAALLAAKLKGEALAASVDLKTLSGLMSGLPEQVRSQKRVQQLQQMIEQARQLSEQQ